MGWGQRGRHRLERFLMRIIISGTTSLPIDAFRPSNSVLARMALKNQQRILMLLSFTAIPFDLGAICTFAGVRNQHRPQRAGSGKRGGCCGLCSAYAGGFLFFICQL